MTSPASVDLKQPGISARQSTPSLTNDHSSTDQPLTSEELRKIDAYWRAANYLSVGQIYLYANPLLREPLKIEHVKPRLLGHWGTTPGLNFVYAHFNRLIKKYDLNVINITGPVRGADFRNFELELAVLTRPACNSGVYFHTAYQERDFPYKGFEVQINNTATGEGSYRERKKTGSLYGLRNVYK